MQRLCTRHRTQRARGTKECDEVSYMAYIIFGTGNVAQLTHSRGGGPVCSVLLGGKDAQSPVLLIVKRCRGREERGGDTVPKYPILTSTGAWLAVPFCEMDTQYRFSIPAPLLMQPRSLKTGLHQSSWCCVFRAGGRTVDHEGYEG
jgi:hypothetical protein